MLQRTARTLVLIAATSLVAVTPVCGDGISGTLGLSWSQSSSQSISSTSPSLTTTNGFPGGIQSGVLRPFVTGITPIVNEQAMVAGIANRVGRQRLSALQHSQAQVQDRKLQTYLRRAERAESEGKLRMARANYQGAIRIAREPLRSYLQRRLQSMLAESRRP